MEEIVIVAAKRSAIGKFNGSLKNKTALEIACAVTDVLLEDIPKATVDTVYLGNVLQAGHGQNIARQLALHCGLNFDCMATTINAVCGSGMQSIILGIQALKLHDSNLCIVGGVESMSNAPYLLKSHRSGYKFGDDLLIDSMQHDGLYDHFSMMSMIETAEKVANAFHISRKKQDLYAFNSQKKAAKAIQDGVFKNEIVKIDDFDEDEYVRKDISLPKIESLKPLLQEHITAANASGINDGAAMLVLMRKQDCLKQGLKPLAVIRSYATSGCDNTVMGFSPYYAIQKLLAKTNQTIEDFDIIEINEAFASQVIAVAEALKIDENKLNIHGGAIALGHPIGASGARIVVSAVHALLQSDKKTALLSLCIGGGNAIALSIQKYEEQV